MSTLNDIKLAEEARAFDDQILTRVANGHVPDLRLCTPCDWFYNNPWRRPCYVELDFGEQFRLIRDAVDRYAPHGAAKPKVLEVGCGPGYLSLELARAGCEVTGLDLSPHAIEVARRFAAQDPFNGDRASLQYLSGDFFSHAELKDAHFDAIVFLGALHHFPDQQQTLRRVRQLLKPDGIVLVHEPVRDRVTRGNAVFAHLLRVLLSLKGGFFEHHAIPGSDQSREQEFDKLFASMRYETEDGENMQSVNDNEAGYAEMKPVLDELFAQQEFSWRYAFFHEFIGGLRFEDALNEKLAHYLREVDRELCRLGVLSATEFFYVGRNSEGTAK